MCQYDPLGGIVSNLSLCYWESLGDGGWESEERAHVRVTPRRLRSSKKLRESWETLVNGKREREAYICDNLCRPAVCFH